jgi:hypothetical protein
MPLCGFRALVTRSGPRDDAGVHAHVVCGHARVSTVLEHPGTPLLSARSVTQGQRNQAFVQKTDGRGETEVRRSTLGILSCPQHQRSSHCLGQEQCGDLLNDPLRRQRAHGSRRHTPTRSGFSDHLFDRPMILLEHCQFLGWRQERVEQGGHQSGDVFSCPGKTRIGEGVGDDPHQHRCSPVVILILTPVRHRPPIHHPNDGGEPPVLFHASENLTSSLAHPTDRPPGMTSALPQNQALLHRPAFQKETRPAGFPLSAGTEFRVTYHGRRTVHHQDQTGVGKGAMRRLIIGAGAEGHPMACRVGKRLDRSIQRQHAQAMPARSRCVGCGRGSGTLPKACCQQFAAHVLPARTESRCGRDRLWYSITRPPQSADPCGRDRPLGAVGRQMQGHQPVRPDDHLHGPFSFFPHLRGLQAFSHHGRRDHFLPHIPIDLLTALAIPRVLASGRFGQEAVSFFIVMMALLPSRPPPCLPFHPCFFCEPYWAAAPPPRTTIRDAVVCHRAAASTDA